MLWCRIVSTNAVINRGGSHLHRGKPLRQAIPIWEKLQDGLAFTASAKYDSTALGGHSYLTVTDTNGAMPKV